MELLTGIKVKRIAHSRVHEVDGHAPEFGKYVSDHMLVSDYDGQDPVTNGWKQPMIVPFANLSLSPATLALHYGQTVFEGMKAYRMSAGSGGAAGTNESEGKVNIFRIDKHYERFARSLDRMCMAIPPKELFMEGLKKLVELDRAWVPRQPGAALYLRPFMYASEAKFGIKVSEQYRFVIFTGPVPELFASPLRVKVETNYVRAVKGGTGFAKCGGNYGGAYYPTKLAREQGYDQVLWTDGIENKFIEESGSMNVLFVINEVLVTPPLSDSILDGVTRDSILMLARELGYSIEIRPVSLEELEAAFQNKTITEAFGAGTAAVVAPIETIHIKGTDYQLPSYGPQSILNTIKQKLSRIRTGVDEDKYGWNCVV